MEKKKTVYEQIKDLSVVEMACLIAKMVDHEEFPYCECPIGCEDPEGEDCGFCSPNGCDISALEWLKSEDCLYIDVPLYLLGSK